MHDVVTDRSKAVLLSWIINNISVLYLFCFCARLFIDALWSPAGKGLTSRLSFVISYCDFVTFPFVFWLMWCLLVSFPDLCPLSFFVNHEYSF